MNNKGQALIEFILVLPILLLIVFAIIDFGSIYFEKNKIEDISSDVIGLIRKDIKLEDIKKIYPDYEISSNPEEEYTKIIIAYQLDLITPGLGKIISDPYNIKVERYITSES